MKNTKIVVVLAGIVTLLFGFAAKNNCKSDFQAHLGKTFKIHTAQYIVASVCGTAPSTSKKG